MIDIKLNSKGVSLPLVVGLVLLLMLASVTTNELIIKALRSAHQIEASDRAYFAAEAGIEDALYELSEHFAGYETGDITGIGSKRIDDFGGDIDWENDWEIKNLSSSNIFGSANDLYFYPKQKLIIPLYIDTPGSGGSNEIFTTSADITTLDASSNFTITFSVPWDIEAGYSPNTYANGLRIDNDKDLSKSSSEGPDGINGLNEDGPGMLGTCEDYPGEDADCDGKEDEDSDQDSVILWKITNNAGSSLIPIRGCLDGAGTEDDPQGTEICEKDFQLGGIDPTDHWSVTLDAGDSGIDQNGVTKSIGAFLNQIFNSDPPSKLQFEFLIIAPLEQAFDSVNPKIVSIPYLEYDVTTVSDGNSSPLPYFTINADGYYKDFKQSITTTVTPKTAVPLFDFTIIQQQ